MQVTLKILYDDEDHDLISKYNWYILSAKRVIPNENQYYAAGSIRDKQGKWTTIQMHRLLMGEQEGKVIDHINGNGLDNRRCNLRFATYSQNFANSRSRHGSSKYKGVTLRKTSGSWQAAIQVNKKSYYLGNFRSEIEAAKAYDKEALRVWGEYARLNFPPLADSEAMPRRVPQACPSDLSER